MQYLYPFIVSFIFIFLSELGDKTQILVLSFSAKNKALNILLGVALGTLLSHGLAIAFGSQIALISNDKFVFIIKFITYCTFLIFGITGFIRLKKSASNFLDNSQKNQKANSKSRFIHFFSYLLNNCIFSVAFAIAIGELGDKTFLASIGLGIEYPHFKIPLILGSICGMVASDSIAIFLGKWLGNKIQKSTIDTLSSIIFILFGIIGLLGCLS